GLELVERLVHVGAIDEQARLPLEIAAIEAGEHRPQSDLVEGRRHLETAVRIVEAEAHDQALLSYVAEIGPARAQIREPAGEVCGDLRHVGQRPLGGVQLERSKSDHAAELRAAEGRDVAPAALVEPAAHAPAQDAYTDRIETGTQALA